MSQDNTSNCSEGVRALSRFCTNLCRAHFLAEHSKTIDTSKKFWIAEARDDILRAAVVLMHAAFEDYLRALLRIHLLEAPVETLEAIPLVGGKKGKFTLGALKDHQDKVVRQVLTESIDAYLQTTTFNSATEVMGHLKSIGLLTSVRFEATLAKVDEVIKRRHQIVHEADQLPSNDSGEFRTITFDQVEEWHKAIRDAAIALSSDVILHEVWQAKGIDRLPWLGKALCNCPKCSANRSATNQAQSAPPGSSSPESLERT